MRRCSRLGWIRLISLLIPSLLHHTEALAQDDDDLRPGLLAAFSAGTSPADAPPVAVRVDPDLQHHWGRGAPDLRVPARSFRARWHGRLLVQIPGPYRFHARSDGAVRLTLDGRVLLDGRDEGNGLVSKSVEFSAGLTPLVVEYQNQGAPAYVAIDWEGPGFAREKLPARLLFHEVEDLEDGAPDRFEPGRRLADRLGCANCHTGLGLPAHPELGPPLDRAARDIDRDYLASWLADPPALRPGTPMPAVGHGLPEAEVADLIAFLDSVAPEEPSRTSDEMAMALNVADAQRGDVRFHSLGCLGCHPRGGDATDPRRGAGEAPDLSDVARKRTVRALASYLARPAPHRPGRHRPDLRLSPDEAADLAAYLTAEAPEPLPAFDATAGSPQRGRRLVEAYRCASCHAIPGVESRPLDRALGPNSNPETGCLAPAGGPPRPGVPRFDLGAAERADLQAFVAGLPSEPSPLCDQVRAEDALRRRNCLGCHARDGRGGEQLGSRVAVALSEDPALGALKGTLTPPDLSAVGDKFRPEFLSEAVRGQAPTARPWLSVRMPVYDFAPGEVEALLAYLQAKDRTALDNDHLPDPPSPPEPLDEETIERGTRLIGQRGFGCVSCHVLAGKIPPGGEPETLGPDLALAHHRMTERYFRRWIADPQRIIPGTPMPQFLEPIATEPGSLDDQLATLWRLLAGERLDQIAAFGTREVLERRDDRALVVHDMVLLPGDPVRYTPRGLAIGLKNDHALLFDADRLGWLAWWRGGFLYRTKAGRLWEWHPDGTFLWRQDDPAPPVVFERDDGSRAPPSEVRERWGSFLGLGFEGDGVTIAYRLHGPDEVPVDVHEHIAPTDDGWHRQVRVSNVPRGFRPVLVERLGDVAKPSDDRSALLWSVGSSPVTLSLDTPLTSEAEAPDWTIPMPPAGDGDFEAMLRLSVR